MKFVIEVEEVEVFTQEFKGDEDFIEEVEEYIDEVKEVVQEVDNPQRMQCLQNWLVPTLNSPKRYEFDIMCYRFWLDVIFV